MKPLTLKEISVGMPVVFIDRNLNRDEAHVDSDRASLPLDGQEGVVVAVATDAPGKMVTVALKASHPKAHTCDGFVTITTDVDGTPQHHGVWARPEHLYTPERHAEHKAARAKADDANREADAAKAKAQDVAAKYLGR
jgi:hypothetical protein